MKIQHSRYAQKKVSKNYRPHLYHSVFHPIVACRTGQIVGYEALTRGHGKWRMPEEMFRYSYEMGITIALNLQCLYEAFTILPKISRNKLLFVNVEPVTLARAFQHGKEMEFLLNHVRAYRHQIVFELTEGMKSRDFKYIQRGVHYLQKMKCHFAIDDVVGIGSKLYTLFSLKPRFIKLGMEVIQGIARNQANQEFVRELQRVSREHRSLIIAEGVEKKTDYEYLRKIDVPYAQGFYLARPSREPQKTIRRH